jgi:GNAT superfamily N-acetyltransferase
MLDVQIVDLSPDDPRLYDEVLPVLAELRTHLDAEKLRAVYEEGHPQGLRYSAVYDDEGRCVAVAGWRVMATTVVIRKLHVDDLVTAAEHRGKGYGAALLQDLERRARGAACNLLDLDSGTFRTDAHRFYFRERMVIVAFHFGHDLTE